MSVEMTAPRLPQRLMTMPNALLLPLLPLAALCMIACLYFAADYRIPEQIPYWTFFFGLPHIIASFQTMCDAPYLAAYRTQLPVVLGLMLLPLVLALLRFPPAITLGAFLIMTVYHVIAQQFGIALAAARLRPSRLSALCKWSTVLLGTLAYLQSYLSLRLIGSAPAHPVLAVANALVLVLLVAIAASGACLVWQARAQRTGALLLALNIALFLLALLLIFWTPYVLVGLILARVLHDLSGFVVYIQHDVARNRAGRKNILYRLVPFLPVWALNLAFSLGIAAALTYLAGRMETVGWLVVGITSAHYYIEGVIWRGGTPHRQHLRLS